MKDGTLSPTSPKKKIIKEFKPDVVMGTGGYVTGPVLYAAHKLKIPTLVHESNAYPGVTVRILSRHVDVVALAMQEAAKFLPKCRRTEVTGNPIRPSILKTDRAEARKKLMLDGRAAILIFGGSLGANKLNAAAADWICKTADDKKYQIIMSTGKKIKTFVKMYYTKCIHVQRDYFQNRL